MFVCVVVCVVFDTGYFAVGGGGNISSIAYSGFVRGFFCWCGGVIDCMCNWYPKLLRKHDRTISYNT